MAQVSTDYQEQRFSVLSILSPFEEKDAGHFRSTHFFMRIGGTFLAWC